VSALVTVVVALIGSIGAGLVYIWQKSVDRKEKYRSEKQAVYKGYLGSLRRVMDATISVKATKNDVETLTEYNAATRDHNDHSDLLDLYSSKEIQSISIELEKALLEWRKSIESGQPGDEPLANYFGSRHKLVAAMRRDLFGDLENPKTAGFLTTSFGRFSRKNNGMNRDRERSTDAQKE